MIEYTKIPAIYKRDVEGGKKLIDGEYCDETVRFLSYCTWCCTEKIDGTNIGVVWDGHRVSFQGRTERAQIPAPLVNKLTEMFGGTANEELFEQKFGEMPVILFGGGLYRTDVSFILFDVYLPNSNLWLKRDAVEDIAKTFGIDVVPVIMRGTLDHAVEAVGNSAMDFLAYQHTVLYNREKRGAIMIEIKLEKGQNGYDAVGEWVKRYWKNVIHDDVLVSMCVSYTGLEYEPLKEIASPLDTNDVEFFSDWWEGHPFIKIYGIRALSYIDIDGGLYA